MEFLNELTETWDSIKLKQDKGYRIGIGRSYEDYGFRQFNGIQINERVRLSIQASFGMYCSPRKTIDKEDYTSMELAVLMDGEFASVDAITEDRGLIEAFEEYSDGTVYGYVPVELIEKLYQEVKKERA